jgi:hypothetical protein
MLIRKPKRIPRKKKKEIIKILGRESYFSVMSDSNFSIKYRIDIDMRNSAADFGKKINRGLHLFYEIR